LELRAGPLPGVQECVMRHKSPQSAVVDRVELGLIGAQPEGEAIRTALDRLLASSQFAKSPRASRFLRYIVDAALAGGDNSLKEYVLGIEVFDRSPSFDPRIDTIVRVEAVKLRNRLRNYYRGPGRTDPLVIEVPPGAYSAVFRARTPVKRRPVSGVEHSVSLAVLPFTDLSGDRESEYFGDGLAEEIINALTRIPGLKVVARTSAFAFKGKNVDVREIARTLGVSTVLEGSVRRAGSRLRITTRLVAAVDHRQLWSQSYDREITDVFAIQEEISRTIVDILKIQLRQNPNQPALRRGTANIEAYHAYLEGRYYFPQLTAAALARSRECHERAIRLDPNYALPHVGLAEYYYYLAFYLNARPCEVLPLALAAAERALELDRNSAEGCCIRGTIRAVYQYDWDGAGEDFARAIELNPALAVARHRRSAWYLRLLGRLDESLAEVRRALELDPLNVLIRASEPYVLMTHGKKTEALQRARDLTQLFPGVWVCSFFASAVLGSQGFHDEAATVIRRGLAIDSGNPFLLACLAMVCVKQGDSAEPRRILGQLEETAASQYVSPAALEIACVACGEIDRAYRWLDKGVEERDLLTLLCAQSPMLPKFQSDPRYHALLQKMNLSQHLKID
jgi:TolB-like protein/Flp pilus assembly protein TadD